MIYTVDRLLLLSPSLITTTRTTPRRKPSANTTTGPIDIDIERQTHQRSSRETHKLISIKVLAHPAITLEFATKSHAERISARIEETQ